MLVSRPCWLIGGLVILFANICSAQQTSDNSAKHWNNSDTKSSPLAFRRIQSDDDGPATQGNSFQSDDETAPGSNRKPSVLDQLGQTPFVWPRKSIREIGINPKDPEGKKPADRSFMLAEKFSRNWTEFETICKDYRWQSPGISYQPLYFEDVALERYGQSRPGFRQAMISYGHFFTSTALLPFHMRKDPPFSCEYPLGYCRPGNCAPKTHQKQFWW
jgi:hypothetical protein